MTPNESIAFTHATILDGTASMEPQQDMTVVVDRGVIGAGRQGVTGRCSSRGARGRPGRRVPAAGAHQHACAFLRVGSAHERGRRRCAHEEARQSAGARRGAQNAAQERSAAVCERCDHGARRRGPPVWRHRRARRVRCGKYVGPRIMHAGNGHHGRGRARRGLFAQIAESPERAAELVREIAAHGADVIKLFVTGGVFDATKMGEPGVLRMSPQIAAAACSAAQSSAFP